MALPLSGVATPTGGGSPATSRTTGDVAHLNLHRHGVPAMSPSSPADPGDRVFRSQHASVHRVHADSTYGPTAAPCPQSARAIRSSTTQPTVLNTPRYLRYERSAACVRWAASAD
jgi:hypothetical protein